VFGWVEGGADDDAAVFGFGLGASAGELDAVFAEDFDGFGAEAVAGPGEADGFGDFDFVETFSAFLHEE